jgi:hypothetical protein
MFTQCDQLLGVQIHLLTINRAPENLAMTTAEVITAEALIEKF